MSDIMICGEDLAELRLIERLLDAEGFRAESFSHLSEAVTPCLRRSYRLAIISLGYSTRADTEERLELIRVIHKLSPELPLVVVSDPESLEIERELRSLGIFYLLTTPVSVVELRDVVRCAFRKKTTGYSSNLD